MLYLKRPYELWPGTGQRPEATGSLLLCTCCVWACSSVFLSYLVSPCWVMSLSVPPSIPPACSPLDPALCMEELLYE